MASKSRLSGRLHRFTTSYKEPSYIGQHTDHGHVPPSIADISSSKTVKADGEEERNGSRLPGRGGTENQGPHQNASRETPSRELLTHGCMDRQRVNL
jgi:hypothetical protein